MKLICGSCGSFRTDAPDRLNGRTDVGCGGTFREPTRAEELLIAAVAELMKTVDWQGRMIEKLETLPDGTRLVGLVDRLKEVS